MGLTDKCSCNIDDCNKTWDRHPILEISCPQCNADVGSLCKRPSGHQPWGQHGRFHNHRYYQALDEGYFGDCPLDRCPESSEVSKARMKEHTKEESIEETEQTTLFG